MKILKRVVLLAILLAGVCAMFSCGPDATGCGEDGYGPVRSDGTCMEPWEGVVA